jgi:hypothetical protein
MIEFGKNICTDFQQSSSRERIGGKVESGGNFPVLQLFFAATVTSGVVEQELKIDRTASPAL